MADLPSLEKLRPCGRLETYSTARHHLGFYTNVATTCTYISDLTSISLKPLIYGALRQVIATHSILSAIPLAEDQNYPETYFARLPSINLDTCVAFAQRKTGILKDGESDEEFNEILSEQHCLNFKESLGTRPFWRVLILTSPSSVGTEFTAIWTAHHGLADGTSGLVFHRAFLTALQSVSISTSSEDPIVVSPTTPLNPPLEDLHPLPISLPFLAKQQWNEWFPTLIPKLWTGSPITPPPNPDVPSKTNIKILTLSSSQTAQLITTSRSNNTTVTATLQTLISSALLENLDGDKYDTVSGDGALSLRRNLNLEGKDINDEMGVWVSRYTHKFSRQPFSWNEARSVRKTIIAEVAKNAKNSVVGLLCWVPDLQQFFMKKVGTPRGDSFEISNVGVFKTTKGEGGENKWRIGKAVFSQCGSVAGSAFSVSVVTGGDGCLCLAFSWLEGIVEGSLMDKVLERVRRGVDEILGVQD